MSAFEQFAVTIAATFIGLEADEEPRKESHAKTPRSVFRWRVTIGYQGREYTGDYRAGVAHCTRDLAEWRKKTEGYKVRPNASVRVTREIGRALKPYGSLATADCEGAVFPIPPTAAGYLSCLQLDARCGEHLLFEDYCSELGEDPDSRRAERTWRACQETRGHMQRLFGADFEAFMSAESE